MNNELLTKLLNELAGICGIKDVAYHEIKDGKLCPVLKTDTEVLGIEKWKNAHYQNPVLIKHTAVLMEMMKNSKTVVIDTTKDDPRSASEFFFFNIESIMIIPVVKDSYVKGIIVVASIGQLHKFTTNEVELCEKLVDEYINLF